MKTTSFEMAFIIREIMIINVLVCTPDGGQAIEEIEVVDNWFIGTAVSEEAQSGATQS